MEHLEKFDIVKTYYKRKLWDDRRVRLAVEKNWITPEEYTEITGNPY